MLVRDVLVNMQTVCVCRIQGLFPASTPRRFDSRGSQGRPVRAAHGMNATGTARLLVADGRTTIAPCCYCGEGSVSFCQPCGLRPLQAGQYSTSDDKNLWGGGNTACSPLLVFQLPEADTGVLWLQILGPVGWVKVRLYQPVHTLTKL
jgi:hypothetical protein